MRAVGNRRQESAIHLRFSARRDSKLLNSISMGDVPAVSSPRRSSTRVCSKISSAIVCRLYPVLKRHPRCEHKSDHQGGRQSLTSCLKMSNEDRGVVIQSLSTCLPILPLPMVLRGRSDVDMFLAIDHIDGAVIVLVNFMRFLSFLSPGLTRA